MSSPLDNVALIACAFGGWLAANAIKRQRAFSLVLANPVGIRSALASSWTLPTFAITEDEFVNSPMRSDIGQRDYKAMPEHELRSTAATGKPPHATAGRRSARPKLKSGSLAQHSTLRLWGQHAVS